ncbi:MAG: hypothetical protein R2774_02085 [Saprospiraceae bacterium]
MQSKKRALYDTINITNVNNIEGISDSIEKAISHLGENVLDSRIGPFEWVIRRESKNVTIVYHQKSGTIIAEIELCKLPDLYGYEIFEFLLLENQKLDFTSLSIQKNCILLSMLLNDQYITDFILLKYIKNLLDIGDKYNASLIQKFGCNNDQ